MRACLALAVALTTLGCATTVHRMDGEIPLATGHARTECEKRDWLVLGPTRYEVAREGAKVSVSHSDGAALYRVGARDPEDIPESALDAPDILARKAEEVRPHDRDRMIGWVVAGAGVIAVTTGVALFISSFEEVDDGQGGTDSEVNGGRAAAGAITFGSGFVLGIVGIAINPDHAERVRAEASRFVFNPREDDPRRVKEIVERHNARVRQRCEAYGDPGGEPAGPTSPPADHPDTAPWLQDSAPSQTTPPSGSPAPQPGAD
ncbi:MAG: hypothetical protein KIT72_12570 [Polyangiaceae bacterium]|nr:hypothetical protein [Polyangiaceae bacterium]